MRLKIYLLILILLSGAMACQTSTKTKQPIYEELSKGTLKPGQPLPVPTDDIILTIEGNIRKTNQAGTAAFDLPMLEQLRQVQYDVHDPFVEQQRLFSGILMSDLLSYVDMSADATSLELIALNEYSAEIEVADTEKWPVLFALQADQAYFPLEDGGPAIIIWPFDDFPELDQLKYKAYWVWSMNRIVVK